MPRIIPNNAPIAISSDGELPQPPREAPKKPYKLPVETPVTSPIKPVFKEFEILNLSYFLKVSILLVSSMIVAFPNNLIPIIEVAFYFLLPFDIVFLTI